MPKSFVLIVPMTFTEDDIQTILNEYNEIFIDEDDGETPITMEEFKENKDLQNFMISELQSCTIEVVESSPDAISNGWLENLKDHR